LASLRLCWPQNGVPGSLVSHRSDCRFCQAFQRAWQNPLLLQPQRKLRFVSRRKSDAAAEADVSAASFVAGSAPQTRVPSVSRPMPSVCYTAFDMTGKLSIVGTPIGNLEDITLRALRALREADLIAAEDTRHTAVLLARHDIRKPLVSYHEFNEARRCPELLEKLRHGQHVALVSDAGMPTVSDPGYRLIRAALDAGIPVEVAPGPSAITAALAVAGLPATPFYFHGFLPHKTAQRRKLLSALHALRCTLVFFESPHRLLKTLADIRDVLGNRRVVVARELTKKFEQILRGDAASLLKSLENRAVKGEITLIVEGWHEQTH
jgi:16S rRNA (cytidine1402-2'-O)-methyltransferase